uniref:Uncharacterized protein n=1 Tax=viral metagenome TaxID=1070528 RepID=A0A6H1ZFQ0_9ZZZZ
METRIIEIAGVKMEVDLREAKTVESYKIGDSVKILTKEYSHSKEWKSYPGVIIGFDNFKNLPTIIIACLELEYSSCKLRLYYLNSQSENIEICPSCRNDLIIDKARALEMLDKEIEKTRSELNELEYKKDFFTKNFGAYFSEELILQEK